MTHSSIGSSPQLTQDGLVNYLIERGDFDLQASHRVISALRTTDRKCFCPKDTTPLLAYQDKPLSIGQEQTISAPHMHALCLDLLNEKLVPGARALDVGAGSGYLTACMGKMVSPGGQVLGVEIHADLALRAAQNIAQCCPELVQEGTPIVKVLPGNVLDGMLTHQEPFDAIHVGAAAPDLPLQLLQKLAPGGCMVCPMGIVGGPQQLMRFDKDLDGNITHEKLFGVMYVPLVDPTSKLTKFLPQQEMLNFQTQTQTQTSQTQTSHTQTQVPSESQSNSQSQVESQPAPGVEENSDEQKTKVEEQEQKD